MNTKFIGRIILTLVLAALLFACDDEERDTDYPPENNTDPTEAPSAPQPQTLLDMDLTGTWLYTVEERIFHTATGDYMKSNFIESTMIFDDPDNRHTVLNDKCSEHNGYPTSGIKTDTRLYLNIGDEPFTLSADNTLTREEDVLNHPEGPNLRAHVTHTLQHIDSGTTPRLDNGNLTIDGDLVHSESDHVCLQHTYDSPGTNERYDITTLYDDRTLTLSIKTVRRLIEGNTYTIDTQSQSPSDLESIEITSNATAFENRFERNTLSPTTASVDITTATEANYTGIFSFTAMIPNPDTTNTPPTPAEIEINLTGSFAVTPQFEPVGM